MIDSSTSGSCSECSPARLLGIRDERRSDYSIFRESVARHTVIPALTQAVLGFGAATAGVVLGIALAS